MKIFKIELKWAFVFIITLLTWSFIEKTAGFHDEKIAHHAVFSTFFFIPAVIIYVFALREKKLNYYKGVASFGKLLSSGMILTAIIAIINPLTQWIITNVIAPDYFPNIIEYSVNEGLMTQKNAEEYFNYASYVVQGSMFTVINGLVTSLIVAAFLRTKKRNF